MYVIRGQFVAICHYILLESKTKWYILYENKTYFHLIRIPWQKKRLLCGVPVKNLGGGGGASQYKDAVSYQ